MKHADVQALWETATAALNVKDQPELTAQIWNVAVWSGDTKQMATVIADATDPPSELRAEWSQIQSPVGHRVAYLSRRDTPVDDLRAAVTDKRVSVARAIAENSNITSEVVDALVDVTSDEETLTSLCRLHVLRRLTDPVRSKLEQAMVCHGPSRTIHASLRWLRDNDPEQLAAIVTDDNKDTYRRYQTFMTLLASDHVKEHPIGIEELDKFIDAVLASPRHDYPRWRFASDILDLAETVDHAARARKILASSQDPHEWQHRSMRTRVAMIRSDSPRALTPTQLAKTSDSKTTLTELGDSHARLMNTVSAALAANPNTPSQFWMALTQSYPATMAYTHPTVPKIVQYAVTYPNFRNGIDQDTTFWESAPDLAGLLDGVDESAWTAEFMETLDRAGRLHEVVPLIPLSRHECVNGKAAATIAATVFSALDSPETVAAFNAAADGHFTTFGDFLGLAALVGD